MTKEELKKEAIKYAVDYPTSYGKGYKHKDLRIAYLAGAEPREKRIAELEKENAELKLELTKKADTNHTLVEQMADLESKNAELKEKINILENCDRLGDTITEAYKEQLAQAKEIIKGLLDLPDLVEDRTIEHTELIGRAEQFLEEEK